MTSTMPATSRQALIRMGTQMQMWRTQALCHHLLISGSASSTFRSSSSGKGNGRNHNQRNELERENDADVVDQALCPALLDLRLPAVHPQIVIPRMRPESMQHEAAVLVNGNSGQEAESCDRTSKMSDSASSKALLLRFVATFVNVFFSLLGSLALLSGSELTLSRRRDLISVCMMRGWHNLKVTDDAAR